MAKLKGAWARLHPVLQVVVAAVSGSVLLVGGALLLAMLWDLMDGTVSNWAAMRPFLVFAFCLGCVVVGAAYWVVGPQGRRIWTPERVEELRKMRDELAKLRESK